MKHDPSSTLPGCIEGIEAFKRFDEGVRQILSVPHAVIIRRERAYKKKVDASPKRRGPKQILKPSSE